MSKFVHMLISETDGNLNGYHKKKYVCKVLTSRTPNTNVVVDKVLASLHLYTWMECRFWTFRSRQPDFRK
jgi:hypothetical protein